MNVYDFDNTILYGDSEDYFLAYMYANYPKIAKYRKQTEQAQIDLHLYRADFDKYLYRTYEFLKEFSKAELDCILVKYWDEHQHFVKDFYLKQQQPTDVITSATPRFILQPIMDRLGIRNLIATDFDPVTLKLDGQYNYKQIKVVTFRNQYPDAVVDEFYSDSDSDTPMAEIAVKAYKVTDYVITPWFKK